MNSDLNRLTETFKSMAQDGLKINDNLRWGYFFVDRSKEKLQQVFVELKEHGYTLQDISRIDRHEWRLSVFKVETLTPEKLHRRNVAFNELADYCGVARYDGWDVEKHQNGNRNSS